MSHPQPITQPGLFETPVLSVDYDKGESLDSRFSRWIEANPQVLTAFIHFADEAKRRGWTRVGAKSLAERLRWELRMHTEGDPFKVNNSFVSRLAREAVKRRPDLTEMFEFRELKS